MRSLARTAVLVFNPAAGRGAPKADVLPRVLSRLSALGVAATPRPTSRPGQASELARAAAASGVDVVIAWGGDGTLNEVVRGILHSTSALGVLPGGTVNVFAREAGIPFDLDRACEILARGELRSVPVGLAGGRPFLLMAGVGLDAAVVHRLSLAAKRGLGVSAFWIEGLKQLVQYDFTPFRVRARGLEHEATTAIIGKTRLFGPGYVVTPEAGIHTAHLDVVLFQGRKRRHYLRYLAGVLAGVHTRFTDVVHFQTDALEIEGGPGLFHQLDGEPVGSGSLRVEVAQGALTVIMPPR